MKLIITEKYKTAQPFARLLGATNKSHVSFNKGNRGYFEGNGWCITWCMGHLIELCLPDQYGDEYKKWSLDNLPIVPKKWMYQPASGANAKYQLGVVKELLNRSDLECVYHAADADKEGELIVRELLTYFGKESVPAKRIWYTNTTDEALTKALAEAKPLSDYDGLAAAALARQQRDWIYGTNLTRAYTAYSHTLQNVGRVVSATINLIVQRQKEIDEFVPKEYGVVSALLDRDDKSFVAAAKYDDLKRAAEVERKIKGKIGRITNIDKTQSSTKRKLFDLTSLQAEAAKRFGYSATQTASIVQTLYENGWMSYPRTNSNYINPEQIDETEPLLGEAHARIFSDMPIDDSDFDINRIVQAKGEGAEASHTGLCPTMQGLEDYASRIKGDDRLDSIFRLVAIRLVASCLPPYITEKTTVSVDIESEPFTAAGTVDVDKGFIAFERQALASLKNKQAAERKRSQVLPHIEVGDEYDVKKTGMQKKQTTPPKPYTSATLLTTMKDITPLLPEKALKDIMKEHAAGLGTQASRDKILETIVKSNFVEVIKGYMYPTQKAKDLMQLLSEDVKSPVTTARMELELEEVATGHRDVKTLMSDVVDTVNQEIDTVRGFKPMPNTYRFQSSKAFVKDGCPMCGGNIVETKKTFTCQDDCGFVLWRDVAKKRVPQTEFKAMLKTGHSTKKLEGFKSKKGSAFSCWLYIDADGKVKFDFSDDGNEAKTQNIFALGKAHKK